MAKIRIYELARELGTDNKTVESGVRRLGIPIKNYMSTLTLDDANRVRKELGAAEVSGDAPPPKAEAPAKKAASPTRKAKVIRRRGADVVRRRREDEESEDGTTSPTAPAAGPPATAAPAEAQPVRRAAPAREPVRSAPVVRREATAEPPAARPTPAPSAPTTTPTPEPAAPTPGPGSTDVPDEDLPSPAVGTRIELPRGTTRFKDGLAQRMADAPAPTPKAAPKPTPSPAAAAASAEPVAADAEAGPPPGTVAEDGAVEGDGEGRRVVRNEDGVIVGAAAQRSEPKILGFIQLESRRKKQVIITDAKDRAKSGRATQRKQREERVQAVGRRRKQTMRGRGRGPTGPRGSNTVEMREEKRRIRVDEAIQISDLAHQMGQKASNLLKTLWGMGMRGITINHAVDAETAEMVAAEFGYSVDNVSFQEDELVGRDDAADGVVRAPVVTIMGHVDHGKTSLLDKIRESQVADGEAGGITQHIGAYKVETAKGDVVFLDTPGHEAFSAMRERGAQVTDVVVLVVAADDGVMPTTIEAIKHAQKAKVPVIVAINKIDKPEANAGRVKQALMEFGIVGEEFGGEAALLEVSAKTGQGLEALLETLAVQAEILELRAPDDGRAEGIVVEARVDKGRGTVATVLIMAGQLNRGDIIVADEFSGKVRRLFDDHGNQIKTAGPATPVEIIGLDGVPSAGDEVNVVESEKAARQLVSHRRELRRRKESVRSGPSIHELIQRNRVPVQKIVLRADVKGSTEALKQSLEELSTDRVKVEVIRADVGAINETDIKFAHTADASVIGFNVKTTGKAAPIADQEGVAIYTFNVIYEAIDKVKELMVGLLEPEYRERDQGEAEVRALFPIPRLGVVAGCRVIKGSVQRSNGVRVVRDGETVFKGSIGSLRVFKEDVKEVRDGAECGIVVEGYPDVREGDIIQAFDVETIAPTL